MHPLAALAYNDEKGKIFVGGLSWDTTVESLLRYFARYGEVIDCVVMKNPTTGKSRGFGFVTFRDPNCVETVLAAGPHTLDGRVVDPKACNPRHLNKGGKNAEVRNKKVFVGGLPTNCTEAQLKESFTQYGKVAEVAIMFDQQKQRSRGFGFVTFEAEESVDRVCQQHYVHISGKQVEVKRAEPRDALAKPNAADGITSGSAASAMQALALQTATGLPGLQLIPIPQRLEPVINVAGNGVAQALASGYLPQGANELSAAGWTPNGVSVASSFPSQVTGSMYTNATQTAIPIGYGSYALQTGAPTLSPYTQANAASSTTNTVPTGSTPVQSSTSSTPGPSHPTAELPVQEATKPGYAASPYPVPFAGMLGTYTQEASSYGPARGYAQEIATANPAAVQPYNNAAASVAYAAGPSLIAGTYTTELNATYLGMSAHGLTPGLTPAAYSGQGDGILHTPAGYAPAAGYGRLLASHLVAAPGFHPYRR